MVSVNPNPNPNVAFFEKKKRKMDPTQVLLTSVKCICLISAREN